MSLVFWFATQPGNQAVSNSRSALEIASQAEYAGSIPVIGSTLTSIAKAQGIVSRNVAELVNRVNKPHKPAATYTEAEVQALLAAITDNRLGHAWELALSGLRRGEIAGLRWLPLAPNKGSRRRVQPRGLVFTAVQGVISRDTCQLAGHEGLQRDGT